jgi:hypothetical protein
MCPFCIATTMMIAGSIGGTGGLAAAAGAVLRKQNPRSTESEEKEVRHGDDSDGGRSCTDAA